MGLWYWLIFKFSSMLDNLAVNKLWILSCIDKLMYQNKDNRKLFITLF